MPLLILPICCLLLSSVAVGPALGEVSESLALVTASQGHIVGIVKAEAAIFWGIPYSQAPVGKWRWKSPRNPLQFNGSYWNATHTRAACMQNCPYPVFKGACPSKMSEDCLFLNVFVPRQHLKPSNRSDLLNGSHYSIQDNYTSGGLASSPVMVFLHGGNFITGAGSNILYDGRFLAHRGNVVIVTINYRLGPFGFLVQGSGEDAAKGNYGILDQIKALEWVKNNIRYFGGNPEKVTLFGQSAGAESVGILMTSPLGEGIFHQAIYESDPLSLPYRSMTDAKVYGSKFARDVGCPPGNMTCLRNVNGTKMLAEILKSTKFFSATEKHMLLKYQKWGPVIDGKVIIEHPMAAFKKGNFHRMPVIMGYNVNEAYLFIEEAIKTPLSSIVYEVFLTLFVKNSTEKVLKQYPPCTTPNCDNRNTLRELTNDFIFKCPTTEVEYFLKPRSWLYIFNASIPFKGIWKTSFCRKKACHGSELPYVFDTTLLTKMFHFTSAETQLSLKIQYYWTNFAKYGNPNGSPLIKVVNWANAQYWNRFYNYRNKIYKGLDMTTLGNHVILNPDEVKCRFWDKLDKYGTL